MKRSGLLIKDLGVNNIVISTLGSVGLRANSGPGVEDTCRSGPREGGRSLDSVLGDLNQGCMEGDVPDLTTTTSPGTLAPWQHGRGEDQLGPLSISLTAGGGYDQ